MKRTAVLIFILLMNGLNVSKAQSSIEIYGHVMTDIGYNFGQINPQWFDVMRPTQLASFRNQYAPDGNIYFSVRQTRNGIRYKENTKLGELKLWFEWELFGVGVDAGQTTFRLRHAYAELGKFGVGQTVSPFMDMDIFPNSIEYWGPNAMIFFRNIQFRYMPIQGDTKLTIALERPGASADGGLYAEAIALEDVHFRFPVPDLSAEYRQSTSFGYVELGTMLRYIKWEDNSDDLFDLSGSDIGWGLNLSSHIRTGKKGLFKFQLVYGEGIQNYMNGGGVDIGVVNQFNNPRSPIRGEAMPVLGGLLFYDITWNEKFTSTIGFSTVDVDVTDGQAPASFQSGNYALANLIYYPWKNVMAGVELQYGKRENFNDGWETDIVKLQFSFKYQFSKVFETK